MKLLSLLSGLVSSLVIGAGWIIPVVAEIVPDSTLPQPSRVTRTGGRSAITEGTRRGRNLFHSFREFSVAPGETASFQGIDSNLANIFARITGGNPSRINGMIEALEANGQLSSANLFLLNPNGIIFGKNAALRIGGSFIATTADSIRFSDGTEFSAVKPQTTPLLSVSVPIGLQFGRRPGDIINRSLAPVLDASGEPIIDPLSEIPLAGLQGSPNHTLALVGGDVRLTGRGSIISNGGRVEIGSVQAAGQVTLTPIAEGWDLNYEGGENFGDIYVSDFSRIDTSGDAAGAIQIQGRRVSLGLFSLVFSVTSTQPGSALEITASDAIHIEGSVTTATQGSGTAGDVLLSTRRLLLESGGKASSITYQNGKGGSVIVNAADSVTLGDPLPSFGGLNVSDRLSSLFVRSAGLGEVGDLTITTNRLEVQSGGQISAATFNARDAGDITIQANEIELIGIASELATQNANNDIGLPISGGLVVGTSPGSRGAGGTLNVTTRNLSLRDGAILQATTYGSGNAGNIEIEAAESVEVSGVSERAELPSRIIASSGGLPGFSTGLTRGATGRGGNLNLRTNRLLVQDRGTIAVNSRNQRAQGAGNINITANQILLDNRAQLNAETESGDDAGIQLTGVELLTLRRNSNISTSAGGRSGGGDGGDITIADADLILNAPAENSDINADAGEGNGGNIDINAQGILGIAERAQQTFQSDITATSESGVNGEISISNPTLDPTQGIVELPSTVVDASRLIAQGCRAGNQAIADELGEFVITGRGGVPPSPTDLRSSSAVMTEWATLPHSSQATSPEQGTLPTAARENNPRVIEAQGWVVGKDGKIALVANAPTVMPYSPNWTLPHCIGRL